MLWLGKESRGDDMPMSVVGDVKSAGQGSTYHLNEERYLRGSLQSSKFDAKTGKRPAKLISGLHSAKV